MTRYLMLKVKREKVYLVKRGTVSVHISWLPGNVAYDRGKIVHGGQKVAKQAKVTTPLSIPYIVSRLFKVSSIHTLNPRSLDPSIAP